MNSECKKIKIKKKKSKQSGWRTRLKPCNPLPNPNHNSRALMPQPILPCHHHRPNMSMFPEMHVRAADARRAHMNQTLVRGEFGDVAFDEAEVVRGVGLDGEV